MPELALTLTLAMLAVVWRPYLMPLGALLAEKPRACAILLAALPLVLRFALLGVHPVPVPTNYDEFSHLLVADTLLNGRLANAPHTFARFFETFFVLQEPTYSSIYPIGLGLSMAIGKLFFGLAWAGVLLTTAGFATACYWMLRGWTTPRWALAGGLLAALAYGPLSPWMNTYWGGSWTATAGCLVFGALPRLRAGANTRAGVLLGLGLGMHLLSRPFETVFLCLAAAIYLAPRHLRRLALPALVALPAPGLTLLQNHAVTGHWLTSPYVLSQEQYGVPAPLTFQPPLTPHRVLTPGQEMDFRMQAAFRPPGGETIAVWFARLGSRIRSWRFYFYPALYLAPALFVWNIRRPGYGYIAGVCVLFALGTNFFPAFRYHYIAGIACLFTLMTVEGLRHAPAPLARWLLALGFLHFGFWYAAHAAEPRPGAQQLVARDLWNGINHADSPRRDAAAQLAAIPGDLLVFVRYYPGHIFQEEWVWNDADIDRGRIIMARDLGDAEDLQLIRRYQGRTVLLLEPDALPPRLSAWEPQPASPPSAAPRPAQHDPFEPVR